MQLHWAAQAAAGVGRTLLPPQPDESHQSFTWSRRARALVQGVVDGRYRSGIRPRDMALLLLDDADRVTAELPLAGRTLDDGFRFYEERFGRTLARPEAGIPPHPVASGAAFAPDSSDLANLEALYDQANAILERVRASRRGASEVRCWPHHFDIATLISLGGERTVGIGFVPGDTQIAEPYWYVTPWPYPKDRHAPAEIADWIVEHRRVVRRTASGSRGAQREGDRALRERGDRSLHDAGGNVEPPLRRLTPSAESRR